MTGIRRAELLKPAIYDLDAGRGTLKVRQGKGTRDHMVPVGTRASKWIEKYMLEARSELLVGRDEKLAVSDQHGRAFTPNRLSQLVRNYVKHAELGKTGSCHLFRHTMATLMLEGGADIWYIQAMLGRVDLSTTQIYTQVSIKRLQQVHAATHPAAEMRPLAKTYGDDEDEADEPTATEEALLSSLATEAAEEES